MLWCDINVLRCIERKKCVFVDLYIIYVLEYIMRCGFDKINCYKNVYNYDCYK